MRSFEEMATAGRDNLTDKADSMATSWYAAQTRMKAGYDDTPFGPTRKKNYKARIDNAVAKRRFRVDADEWYKNWKAKMAE